MNSQVSAMMESVNTCSGLVAREVDRSTTPAGMTTLSLRTVLDIIGLNLRILDRTFRTELQNSYADLSAREGPSYAKSGTGADQRAAGVNHDPE